MELLFNDAGGSGLSEAEQTRCVLRSLEGLSPKKVLIIPPDITRFHSGAGFLTCAYRQALLPAQVDVMPALGTHVPMTRGEAEKMYPGIPFESFIVHDPSDTLTLGEIEGDYIASLTGGLWTEPIPVQLSRRVLQGGYDLIISIGQVVPHEVIGMSNHSKNLFVGVGGTEMINGSHMLGAVCGLENMMGRDHTPVRQIFDYALERWLGSLPLMFVLTTAGSANGKTVIHGLFIGDTRGVLDAAVASAQRYNVSWLDESIDRCVVYLDPGEYRSTWLGNKAVYRTRMAISDGGSLLILAPGAERFGENAENDRIIRKYGYRGRDHILEMMKKEPELRRNMGAAAHLIHGSSDGRFDICYAPGGLSRGEIESVGYRYADCGLALSRYHPAYLSPGFNVMPEGVRIFFVYHPALGLWIDRRRFAGFSR
ncbi:MAG: DUF2088 domain-containing protein [Oscillospiraceae bacterium]|nr:DUF2088 domain-containing protein [Oscillospiraceae bacterium]